MACTNITVEDDEGYSLGRLQLKKIITKEDIIEDKFVHVIHDEMPHMHGGCESSIIIRISRPKTVKELFE